MKQFFLWMLPAFLFCSTNAGILTQGISHFKDQPYWCGKAKVISVDGNKVLELTSTIKGNRHFGRAFAIYSAKESFAAKDKLIATAKVRGKGKFFIGILKYRPKVGMPVTVFVEPVELTENAKEIKFIFELEEQFEKVFPFVQIQGEGIAYIETFKLEKTADPSLKLSKVIPSVNNTVNVSKAKPGSPTNQVLLSGITGFRDQPYWSGKAKVITANGKKILELTSAVKNGRNFGRAFAPFWTKEMFLPGTNLKTVLKVRGNGKMVFILLKYRPGKGSPVSANVAEIELTDTLKEVKFDCVIDNHYEKVYPLLEIQGPGTLYVESFKLEKVKPLSLQIKAKTPLQIIIEKQPAGPVEFSTTVKDSDLHVVKTGKQNSVEKIKSDKNGKLIVPAAQYPVGTTHIFAAAKGAEDKTYVSVVTAAQYAETDASARKIKLNKNIRILVLGDSLSDFYRGYNYIDRINFWINKYNPGKFSFHNAGVGGDFLERASNRMEYELKHSQRSIYRQNMYNGIFKNEYDYVFIWMGQNDTRCMRKQGYKTPETTPEEQNKYLPLMIKRLKEHCPKAKIVLIAPSPSNEEVFKKREKTWAKNIEIAYYGKPEFVNAYDTVNREICKKYNLDYIDTLSVMRKYNPIKDLYVSDGVHLSDLGGIIVADEILKYFAKEFK